MTDVSAYKGSTSNTDGEREIIGGLWSFNTDGEV